MVKILEEREVKEEEEDKEWLIETNLLEQVINYQQCTFNLIKKN